MKKSAIVSAILALSMLSGGAAFAQGNSDHGRNDQAERRGPPERQDRRDHEGREPVRRGPPPRVEERHEERGAGPNHEFRRGQRLPPEYRHNQYVVNDWRGYNLSRPPRGYHWVQAGGDYVLVAIPTGLILQIHLGN